jgi:hypothetical protein
VAARAVAAPDDDLVRAFHIASEAVTDAGEDDIYQLHITLLHDIFGNWKWLRPTPVGFDAGWRTSDVMALATGIYEDRAFDRMPILADALQDAGCDSDDVLNHLRDPHASHVRGCWVLDLVLGRE